MKSLRPIDLHEGVVHTEEDVKKKWMSATVIAIDATSKGEYSPGPVVINDVDGRYLSYLNLSTLENCVTTLDNFYIVKEFPPNGLVRIPEGVFLLARSDDRQWHRGASGRTMTYDCLWGEDKGNMITGLILRSYNFVPTPWSEAIKNVAKNNPVVLDRRHWLIGDKSSANLFFEDVFLGVIVDERFIIPHDESVTLAEEAIHEFGLRKV